MLPDLPALASTIIEFAKSHENWVPVIVFLIGFVKSLAVISLLVPGVVILVAVGALAASSGFQLWPLVLADGLGAVLGYSLSYWAGRIWSDRLLQWAPIARHPEAILRSRMFFEKYGTFSVFLGHFFGPVRAFIAIIAGVNRMRHLPFEIANVTSGFLWSFGVLAPSYYGVTSGFFSLASKWLSSIF